MEVQKLKETFRFVSETFVLVFLIKNQYGFQITKVALIKKTISTKFILTKDIAKRFMIWTVSK
jgi:hypothetical protein